MSDETPTLPTGEANEKPPAAAETAPATQAEETEEIKIGERVFKNTDEAFAYAQSELERKNRELDLAEAYRAGIADAGAVPVPAAPAAEAPADTGWEERFYANPKETLKQYAEEIRESTKRELRGELSQQTQEQKLWSEFYTKHPDLSDFDDDAKATLDKHQDEIRVLARTKGQEAAMAFLAQKTRAKFQQYIERSKPRTDLPNTKSAGAPAGQTNVTPEKKTEEPLDFIAQVRKMRESRM